MGVITPLVLELWAFQCRPIFCIVTYAVEDVAATAYMLLAPSLYWIKAKALINPNCGHGTDALRMCYNWQPAQLLRKLFAYCVCGKTFSVDHTLMTIKVMAEVCHNVCTKPSELQPPSGESLPYATATNTCTEVTHSTRRFLVSGYATQRPKLTGLCRWPLPTGGMQEREREIEDV